MKRYITVSTFKNDYLFSAIDNQQLNDEQIKYAIGVASTRINSIVGGAITKGIRGGYYTYNDIDGLKLNEAKITDASQLAEAKDATEALFEQIGAMTKFAIDTGWDFLSGSFSTSLGAQADAETIDFEASLASLERTVKEALNIYDFSTLFFTEELDVAFFEDDTTATAGQPYVPASDRTLTEAALTARLTSQWFKGENGITIELQVPGQPDQGIVIKGTGGSSTPIGGGVPWLTDKYIDLAAFENNGKNYEIVKYNINKDGSNNAEGILLLVKVGSEIKEFRTWEEIKQYVDNHLALKADRTIVDQNTADIAQLASEIQVIENTWTGTKPVFGGKADLSTLTGDKGAFDFSTGSKLIIRIGTHAYSANDVKTLKVGTQGSFHIHGQNVDATFNVLVADTGALTITDFVSSGTQTIGTVDLRIQEIEQNPKAIAVIDAYTKAEADARFEPKAHVKYTPTFTHQTGFMVANAPAGIDTLPDNTVMAFDLSGISAIATNPGVPADGDQLFIGTIPVRIPNTAGSAALKWATKTNPTDSNVQENYQTKLLEVKLKTFNGNKELDLVSWKDKNTAPTNIDTYTKAQIDAKVSMDDASMTDLENLAIATK